MAAVAPPADRDVLIFQARLAEQAERYEEMVESMKQAVIAGPELSVEERNLLSVGYKNVIGTRRASWRIISSFEHKEEGGNNDAMVPMIREYRAKIEGELRKICNDVLKLLDAELIPKAADPEAKVFYQKMKGDYNRYLAEFSVNDDRRASAEVALEAYQAATETAAADLAPIHPIRLGLALNFSVFHCEIMNNPDQACRIAKSAFDEAIAELDTLSEESYKDSTLIMQLLRDNLTLWTSEVGHTNYIDGEVAAIEDEDLDRQDDAAAEAAQEQDDDDVQEAEPAVAAAQ